MSDIPAPVGSDSASPYKDRHTALMVFGLLEMLLGGLCGLMIPVMLLGQAMTRNLNPDMTNPRAMVPAAVVYGVMATGFVWLGIGSFRARRWARACMLVVAWSWLAIGLLVIVFEAVFLPSMLGAAPGRESVPAGVQTVVVAVVLAVMAVLGIILPGVLVTFYSSRHVRLTCEARDPLPSWTDACPLPVLALSLWLWFGAVTLLSLPPSGMAVLPGFGTLMTGTPAVIGCLGIAALWTWCGWAVYRLRAVGWWIALLCFAAFGLSGLITFLRVDPLEMYRMLGYGEEQLRTMRQYSFLHGPAVAVWSLVGVTPWLALLFYVRRHFRRPLSPLTGDGRS